MDTITLGEVASELFSLQSLATGQVFTRFTSYIDEDATDWSPDFTEPGSGFYVYTYTPSVAGTFKWAGIATNGEVLSINFEVLAADDTVTTSPTPGTITTGSRLCDVRAGVARLCQDWVRFEATSSSADTSVFFDNFTCYENDHHFRGSELWFDVDNGTAANRGLKVRVTASSQNDLTLSLGSGLSAAPQLGDTAFAYNIGGKGERMATYDATINDVIAGLGRAAWIPYTEDLADAWDIAAPWVDIPVTFSAISGAQYYNTDNIWYDIPSHAISVDIVQRKITFSRDYNFEADTKNVRLIGKQVHPALDLDTDLTSIGYEWLVNEVAAQILLNKRDQVMVNKGGARKNNADALRGTAAPMGMLEGAIALQ